MEGILVATAARTQNIQSDERQEAHQRPKCDYWGKVGFRNRLSEGNHHTPEACTGVSSEAGNSTGYYPIRGISESLGGTFPLSSQAAVPPPIVPPTATNGVPLWAFDPHLQLPYTLQWNFSMEQALEGSKHFLCRM
jgi:hypothetical protein